MTAEDPLEGLSRALRDRARQTVTRPRRAAVLVPFVDDGGPLRVVLTRRTDDTPTHAGHVAYPGGMVEPEDADDVAAALREAHEEIGLPPDRVEVLGRLDEFPTITDTVSVVPVVGRVRDLPPLIASPGEVARIFEVPVEALLERERWEIRPHRHQGREWPVFFFPWDGETLWGLSAYITLHVLDLMPFEAPFALHDRWRRGL